MEVYIHADDYGVNLNQSRRILECVDFGLNSVSIMPNSVYLKQCIELLPNNIKKSVHLNFVEGKCCSDSKEIPLLVNEEGLFDKSPQKIWLISLMKKRELKRQLKIEIQAQINCVVSYLPSDYKLRIDSHMHCHMIPLVFEVICELFADKPDALEHLRWSVENISPIIGDFKAIKQIPIKNMIKQIVILIWSIVDKYKLKRYKLADKCGVFWGVMYSGQMYGEKVRRLGLKYCQLAMKKRQSMEILFHPGGLQMDEEIPAGINKGGMEFYLSPNRGKEKQEIKNIKTILMHNGRL